MAAADLCLPPLNTSYVFEAATAKSTLFKTLSCSITLLTVALNLIVIISISHFRQLQTCTNLILLSLAVSDLLVGVAVMPATLVTWHSCCFVVKISCFLFFLLGFILTSASVGNMVLIAVDRYVAICHPLRYASIITPSRVKVCVSVCWFCSVFYNMTILKKLLSTLDFSNSCHQECAVTIDHISGVLDMLITFLCPITVIILLYMRVFVVAVSQARVMRSQISAAELKPVTFKKSEMRAARTLGIVLLVFILCVSPYFSPALVGHDTKAGLGFSAQIWLFYCNSLFNPLIYAFFYPWFRKSVKLIVTFQILQSNTYRDNRILRGM